MCIWESTLVSNDDYSLKVNVGSPEKVVLGPPNVFKWGFVRSGDNVLLGGDAESAFVRTDDAAKVDVQEAERLIRRCDGE